jgi:hypothetical protein
MRWLIFALGYVLLSCAALAQSLVLPGRDPLLNLTAQR